MTHSEITDAVRQGVAPRDVYPKRAALPTEETFAAARNLTLALGRLEDARQEFEAARDAFRAVLDEEDRP